MGTTNWRETLVAVSETWRNWGGLLRYGGDRGPDPLRCAPHL
jgi:hypothetical protein